MLDNRIIVGTMSKAIKFRLAAYTDPAGKWNEDAPKKGNEDDLYVDCDLSNETQGQFIADRVENLSDAGCLMVVADGMGGMNAGEVASAIAIETVKDAFRHDHLTPEILTSAKSRTKYLEKVIIDADAAIKKRSRLDKECEGMGSTLIMAWLYGNDVTVSWCGDSRAYLYRESSGIRQISKDHSYVQGLVDEGKITIEEAFDHPYGNIITRSLGDPEKKAEPESVTVPVIKGDIILVCSDGLSGVLRDRKSFDREGHLLPGLNMEDIIHENRETMNSCREALWAAAESSEWYDNVTAILCEIVEGPESNGTKSLERQNNEPLNKSFINLRIHKHSIKIFCSVAVFSCLCLLACLVCKHFISPNPNQDTVRYIHQRDSLIRVADSIGIAILSGELRALSDTVDFLALEIIEQDMITRYEAIDCLEELRTKAIELRLRGIALKIEEKIDSLRYYKESVPQGFSDIESSINTGEYIINEAQKLVGNSKIEPASRDLIAKFINSLFGKESIDDSLIEEWNNIKRKIIPFHKGKVIRQNGENNRLTEII